mmetsp:Transcript_11444/g.21760  ORF Transcript_11444/g.21760 Transcript_11444/m.21760 type:complete len:186 (-) Transcript_11444:542-1099(-)
MTSTGRTHASAMMAGWARTATSLLTFVLKSLQRMRPKLEMRRQRGAAKEEAGGAAKKKEVIQRLLCVRASMAYFVKERALAKEHAMVRAVLINRTLINRAHPSKQAQTPAMAGRLVSLSRGTLALAPALGMRRVIKAQEKLKREAVKKNIRAEAHLAMSQKMSVKIALASVLMEVFVMPLHAHSI